MARLSIRWIRNLRLGTGLVLATFVVTHLVNHSLGIVSVDAQEAMRRVVSPVYRSAPLTVLLYGSLITHFALGLYSLWRRSTLRLPVWELAQVLLGLCVLPLLIPHAVGARAGAEFLALDTTYRVVLTSLWSSTGSLIRQPLLVVVIAAHLAIGLHFWLRLYPWYRRAIPIVYPAAMLLPVLALLGFLRAGLEVKQRPGPAEAAEYAAASPAGDAAYGGAGYGDRGYGAAPSGDPGYGAASSYGGPSYGAGNVYGEPGGQPAEPPGKAVVTAIERGSYIAYFGGIALVLLAREGRRRWRLRQGIYRVHHASGRTLIAPLGQTLLEALREARIPHAAVCGGRVRCTTCRVRVGVGLEHIPPAQPAERQALARINADTNVRLACQARPAGDVYVTPLVRADASAAMARQPGGVRGREKRVVVMFVDLRESSRLGEERLPYDVIFILNRFFAEMAEALRETDGYYSTFNGDGLMALYGTEGDLQQGARNAMRGAMLVSERLAALNRTLASELRRPLRIGIGLHAGEAIVGTMGPPATPILSALGDTVNVAARLEGRTRDHDCELVVSAECAQAAAVDLSAFPIHEVLVRGRRTRVKYHAIPDPAALRPLVAELESA